MVTKLLMFPTSWISFCKWYISKLLFISTKFSNVFFLHIWGFNQYIENTVFICGWEFLVENLWLEMLKDCFQSGVGRSEEAKPTYKWICEAQTGVVQGSTVLISWLWKTSLKCKIPCFLNPIWNDQLLYLVSPWPPCTGWREGESLKKMTEVWG